MKCIICGAEFDPTRDIFSSILTCGGCKVGITLDRLSEPLDLPRLGEDLWKPEETFLFRNHLIDTGFLDPLP